MAEKTNVVSDNVKRMLDPTHGIESVVKRHEKDENKYGFELDEQGESIPIRLLSALIDLDGCIYFACPAIPTREITLKVFLYNLNGKILPKIDSRNCIYPAEALSHTILNARASFAEYNEQVRNRSRSILLGGIARLVDVIPVQTGTNS